MRPVPANPKIYHITHLENLGRIAGSGCLWSDAERLARGLDSKVVGMSSIKRRRLQELAVPCHPGTTVGQYIPFYLCPRSIMLYLLHKGNHPDLEYAGGQRPIVHLVADLRAAVEWADARGRAWAFSDCNAGARYARFFHNLGDLGEINWEAVEARDFRDPLVKEGKQAEFLVYESFPWQLVEQIGVHDSQVRASVSRILTSGGHQPVVRVERSWYY